MAPGQRRRLLLFHRRRCRAGLYPRCQVWSRTSLFPWTTGSFTLATGYMETSDNMIFPIPGTQNSPARYVNVSCQLQLNLNIKWTLSMDRVTVNDWEVQDGGARWISNPLRKCWSHDSAVYSKTTATSLALDPNNLSIIIHLTPSQFFKDKTATINSISNVRSSNPSDITNIKVPIT